MKKMILFFCAVLQHICASEKRVNEQLEHPTPKYPYQLSPNSKPPRPKNPSPPQVDINNKKRRKTF